MSGMAENGNAKHLSPGGLAKALLRWYDGAGRTLPWRAGPGETADPYRVWLSEIMLQQTTVATVKAYYDAFLARWPTVGDLAAAPLDDVLHAWAGLGYYARARNLHKCAGVVAGVHGGRFPDTEDGLRALPGVGDYTAAAVAAIAFGRTAAAVDGNVVRVLARLHALAKPLPGVRAEVAARARALVPAARPGDFAQALMDLGATVCRPRAPDCSACPWAGNCAAFAAGRVGAYPVKAAAKAKPTRRGIAFWLCRDDGAILLERRAEDGLLGGMVGVPTTEWREQAWPADAARAQAPGRTEWTALPGVVRHTFTHFHLELAVWRGHGPADRNDAIWAAPGALDAHALPTLMKKVARHVSSCD